MDLEALRKACEGYTVPPWYVVDLVYMDHKPVKRPVDLLLANAAPDLLALAESQAARIAELECLLPGMDVRRLYEIDYKARLKERARIGEALKVWILSETDPYVTVEGLLEKITEVCGREDGSHMS